MYVDFGRTYYPVAKAYADLLESMVPSSASCNSTCVASYCIDIQTSTELNCMEAICNCYFNMTSIAEKSTAYQSADNEADQELLAYLSTISEDLSTEMSSFSTLLNENTERLFKFINSQSVGIAGCNSTCVDKCTNVNSYTLFTVPTCL